MPNRKAIILTDAGELLHEHAIRIVQSHDDAIAAFRRPALSGKIRFGVEEDYSTVWVTSPHHLIHEKDPLPIAVYHDGCIFRKWTIEALEKHRKSYRIVYVSTSISGIIAAVESGLAVAPLGLSYMPKNLKVLGPESGFPLLPIARIVLHKSPMAVGDAAIYFERHVTASFRKIHVNLNVAKA